MVDITILSGVYKPTDHVGKTMPKTPRIWQWSLHTTKENIVMTGGWFMIALATLIPNRLQHLKVFFLGPYGANQSKPGP